MTATVTLNAAVRVKGGPTLALGLTLEPESYTVATVIVEAGESAEVALLPGAGTVALLGLRARTATGANAGRPAAVEVTPQNGTEEGAAFPVLGTLVVANAGVLAALVTQGPRTLGVKNTETEAVELEVLTCLDQ
jgi:hypothetical protein